jgi:small-conductance mechanosensitive channel
VNPTSGQVASQVKEVLSFGSADQRRLVLSLVIILLLVLVRAIANRILRGQVEDIRTRYRWRKIITYIVVVVGVFLIGGVWSESIAKLGTFLGLVSAGLAIALRDPIVNLGGWAFIIWRRPFVVGDRIQVAGHAGDVVDQRIFAFTLLEIGNWVNADQSTGRIIHIPNGVVFRDPLANYTRGMQYIWIELPVLVTFESNWKEAKSILKDIADRFAGDIAIEAEKTMAEAAHKYMIFYRKLSPIVYTSVQDSGVLLTLRFLSPPRHRRGLSEGMWEAILEAFAEHDDIDFAYPTQRFYDNLHEGKPGAGGATQDGAPPT